jgi:hypothetical protein
MPHNTMIVRNEDSNGSAPEVFVVSRELLAGT